MEENIDQIINLAITGALLAVLILWFFLRNVRLVSIIAFPSRFPSTLRSIFSTHMISR